MPAGTKKNGKHKAISRPNKGLKKITAANSREPRTVFNIPREFLLKVMFFLLRFLALALPAYVIFTLGIDFTRLQEIIASQTAWLLTPYSEFTQSRIPT